MAATVGTSAGSAIFTLFPEELYCSERIDTLILKSASIEIGGRFDIFHRHEDHRASEGDTCRGNDCDSLVAAAHSKLSRGEASATIVSSESSGTAAMRAGKMTGKRRHAILQNN